MFQAWILGMMVGCAWAGIPGGKTPADINSPDVQVMADFAVTSLNGLDARKGLADVGLSKVTKAERQVVAGINYFLSIEVTEADCSSHCRTEECQVTIFDQEWTQTRDLTHFSCQVIHQKRQLLVGGPHPTSVDSHEVKEAASFAVTALNAKSNSMYASSLIRVKSATVQVVAGALYKLVIEMGETTCRNTLAVKLSDCAINTNGQSQTCTLSILSQAWRKPAYTLLDDFKCQ